MPVFIAFEHFHNEVNWNIRVKKCQSLLQAKWHFFTLIEIIGTKNFFLKWKRRVNVASALFSNCLGNFLIANPHHFVGFYIG